MGFPNPFWIMWAGMQGCHPVSQTSKLRLTGCPEPQVGLGASKTICSSKFTISYCELAYAVFAWGYLFLSLAFLFSIPTIMPDGGSFLFSFAASASNFFTPDLFTSATLRSLMFRTNFALPSSNFSGSGRAAPLRNASVTCSFPNTKQQNGPFESYAGTFHGLTYSSQSAAAFFTRVRKALARPVSFPAFFT